MKYYEIVNKKQYNEYCKRHLILGKKLGSGKGSKDHPDSRKLLNALKQLFENNIGVFCE